MMSQEENSWVGAFAVFLGFALAAAAYGVFAGIGLLIHHIPTPSLPDIPSFTSTKSAPNPTPTSYTPLVTSGTPPGGWTEKEWQSNYEYARSRGLSPSEAAKVTNDTAIKMQRDKQLSEGEAKVFRGW